MAHSCLLTTYLKRSSIPRGGAFKPSQPLPRPWSAPSEAGPSRKLQAGPGLELIHSPLQPLVCVRSHPALLDGEQDSGNQGSGVGVGGGEYACGL